LLAFCQQEHIVGGLVNAVMNRLPPEQRKGYFLQPRTAITLDGLFDAILEADGVSREVLERQRARLRLVNELLAAVDDDKTLDALVEQHHADRRGEQSQQAHRVTPGEGRRLPMASSSTGSPRVAATSRASSPGSTSKGGGSSASRQSHEE